MSVPVDEGQSPVAALARIARRYGTPTYAYDVGRLRSQVDALRAALPRELDLLYSLKANPSLGLCGLMADWSLGADVASAGELLVALKADMPHDRIFVNGPYKSPETLSYLQHAPEAILSVDSLSELDLLAHAGRPHRILLRLRPDYPSSACCGIGSESRFGIRFEDLTECREQLASRGVAATGFHVFSGSQILDTTTVVDQLTRGADLALRAADVLRATPEIVNLGGGFGIPYRPNQSEVDLTRIGDALQRIIDRVKPARVVIELGRYLVAQAGWYLTTVVGSQTHQGRQAAVVDGGLHHRSDICGLGIFKGTAPLVLENGNDDLRATDVLGCLCLPHDVLVESSMLPPLVRGQVLAFPNAGAYGLSASPVSFLSHPAPAEVAFEGSDFGLLRARQAVDALLQDQSRLEVTTLRR